MDETELKQSLREIENEITGNDSKILYVIGDVSDEKNCKKLMDEAVDNFSRIDDLLTMQVLEEYPKKQMNFLLKIGMRLSI
jgi:NAD(P)-dependent dehydrogenase (short-subunit alcohol dehydrogenase family)